MAVVFEILLLVIVFCFNVNNYVLLRTLWVLIGINLLLVIIPLAVRTLKQGKPSQPAMRPDADAAANDGDLVALYRKGARMLSSEFISKEDRKAASRMVIAAARGGCREAVDYLNHLSPEEQAKIQP